VVAAGLSVAGLAYGGACSSTSAPPPSIGDTNPPDGGDIYSRHDAATANGKDSSVEGSDAAVDGAASSDAGAPVLVANAASGYVIGSICANAAGTSNTSTDIYWTSPNPTAGALGGVTEQPLAAAAGSMLISIATNGMEPIGVETVPLPQGVASDLNNVYWVDNANPGRVIQFNPTLNARTSWSTPDAGAPAVVSPVAIAIDTNNIYWVDYSAGTVNQTSKAAMAGQAPGPIFILAPQRSSPRSIATDGVNVYWVDYGTASGATANGTVNAVRVGGTTPAVTSIATNEDQPWAIVTDGKYVYWTDDGNPGSVKRAPITGGVAPTILASGQAEAYGIALDPQGEYVYWTNYMGGTVMKVPVDGSGPIVTLASQQDAPASISVDATNVYWAAGTAIYKTAK
jgi:hypothetical protein